MSDALEAVAIAIFTEMNPNPSVAEYKHAIAERYARAAILAFLDAVDVEYVAKRMILARNCGDDRLASFILTWDREPDMANARSALSALKATASADAGSHTSQK